METRLWNAWIQIRNHQDREFVFRGSEEDAQDLREFLANRDNVNTFEVAEEFADLTSEDVKEEVGQWIADEIE
jgi:hypothetical protein